MWPNDLAEAQNPITRSLVRFHPSVHIENAAQFDYFYAAFKEYCEVAYRLAHLDPGHIDAPYGWVLPREPHMLPEETRG